MYILIYYSKATRLMEDGDLSLLLVESRAYNEHHQITGLLAYIEGTSRVYEEARFIQVLEGSEFEVEKLYEKICTDDRRENITILKREHTQERNFNNWSMKFERIDMSLNMNRQAFFQFDSFLSKYDEEIVPEKVLSMLKTF